MHCQGWWHFGRGICDKMRKNEKCKEPPEKRATLCTNLYKGRIMLNPNIMIAEFYIMSNVKSDTI